jgi:hypothetical protein
VNPEDDQLAHAKALLTSGYAHSDTISRRAAVQLGQRREPLGRAADDAVN